MSEMVLLRCGLNDWAGEMTPTEAATYIAEAASEGLECSGSHWIEEVGPGLRSRRSSG